MKLWVAFNLVTIIALCFRIVFAIVGFLYPGANIYEEVHEYIPLWASVLIAVGGSFVVVCYFVFYQIITSAKVIYVILNTIYIFVFLVQLGLIQITCHTWDIIWEVLMIIIACGLYVYFQYRPFSFEYKNYIILLLSMAHTVWYCMIKIWIDGNVWYAWPICNVLLIILIPLLCSMTDNINQSFIISSIIFPQIFIY